MALTYSYDAQTDVLVVEGVKFAGGMFRHLANPDPAQLCRFERQGDTVVVTKVRDPDDERIDEALALVTKTHFRPDDVLVIRREREWGQAEVRYLHQRVQQLFAERGLPAPMVFVLHADTDCYALPDEAARKVYEHLRRKFANG